MNKLWREQGYSLAEVVMAVGVFVIFLVFASYILVDALRSNRAIFEHLSTQADARRIIGQITDYIRRAEQSNIGSFAINSAGENELIIYTDTDEDGDTERLRIWIEDEQLKKGVIDPVGEPEQYPIENEVIEVMAKDIINAKLGTPLFQYYGLDYAGEGDPLPQPVTTSAVNLVEARLDFKRDPSISDRPLQVKTSAQIRYLKETQ